MEADKYCQLEEAHLVVVTSWEEQVRLPWVLLGHWVVVGRGYQRCLFPLSSAICPAPRGSHKHLDRPH